MKEKGIAPMRISRVALENWKNIARVDTALQKRVFLVGPNASGKSNFLDLFRFLYDLASPGGGFREAIRRRGGVKGVRCLAARRYPDVSIEVSVETEGGSPKWEYILRFKQDNQQRPLISLEKVTLDGQVLLSRPDDDDGRDPERLTQTHLEQVNVNRPFRELVGFFQSVRYLHIVPQLVREPERSVGKANDQYGGDFLEQLARTPERTQRARLKRIQSALRVAVPQLETIELQRDPSGTPHLRGKYEHWRPRRAWQTETQFSDGTLRLMGLLWAVMEGSGPLLLEEPELSLHPEIVLLLPQMFSRVQRQIGRQIILSTHLPDLIKDDGIGLDEVLLLLPSREGTTVKPASCFEEIPELLAGENTLAEAVMSMTRLVKAEQLTHFGEL